MPVVDWYPRLQSERVQWHATFAAQADSNGTTLGLTAGQVTQIGVDAVNVAALVQYGISLDEYRQSATALRLAFLEGPLHDPAPPVTDSPTLAPFPVGSLPGIMARTRQYAGIIKASPNYNPTLGEAYGVIPPVPSPAVVPGFTATAQPGSQVQIKLKKGGYSVIGIYSLRGTGGWEQVGIATRATFTDTRPPLVADTPEVRQYRVRGIVNDVPVGAYSVEARVVTTP